MSDKEGLELYHKYRPKTLEELVGQDEAIKSLQSLIKANKVPHAILLIGPSGVGKTSIGRILKTVLKCSDMDFKEINCADERGIETIRDMKATMSLNSWGGKCKIWLLDEAAVLAPFAQKALLKILEDTTEDCYFFLATTDPNKLLPTIRTRCTTIKVNALSNENLLSLLEDICEKENKEIGQDILARIVEQSDGSARQALVYLHSIMELTNEEEQLNAIIKTDSKQQAISICRELMKPKVNWKDVAKIIKEVDEEPESMRYLILSYFSSVLLNSGSERAGMILSLFENNFYDSKRAGFILACYHACKH